MKLFLLFLASLATLGAEETNLFPKNIRVFGIKSSLRLEYSEESDKRYLLCEDKSKNTQVIFSPNKVGSFLIQKEAIYYYNHNLKSSLTEQRKIQTISSEKTSSLESKLPIPLNEKRITKDRIDIPGFYFAYEFFNTQTREEFLKELKSIKLPAGKLSVNASYKRYKRFIRGANISLASKEQTTNYTMNCLKIQELEKIKDEKLITSIKRIEGINKLTNILIDNYNQNIRSKSYADKHTQLLELATNLASSNLKLYQECLKKNGESQQTCSQKYPFDHNEILRDLKNAYLDELKTSIIEYNQKAYDEYLLEIE